MFFVGDVPNTEKEYRISLREPVRTLRGGERAAPPVLGGQVPLAASTPWGDAVPQPRCGWPPPYFHPTKKEGREMAQNRFLMPRGIFPSPEPFACAVGQIGGFVGGDSADARAFRPTATQRVPRRSAAARWPSVSGCSRTDLAFLSPSEGSGHGAGAHRRRPGRAGMDRHSDDLIYMTVIVNSCI